MRRQRNHWAWAKSSMSRRAEGVSGEYSARRPESRLVKSDCCSPATMSFWEVPPWVVALSEERDLPAELVGPVCGWVSGLVSGLVDCIRTSRFVSSEYALLWLVG